MADGSTFQSKPSPARMVGWKTKDQLFAELMAEATKGIAPRPYSPPADHSDQGAPARFWDAGSYNHNINQDR